MRAVPYRVRYLLRGHLLDPTDMPGAFRLGRTRPVTVAFSGEVREVNGEKSWVNLCDAETIFAPDPTAFQELNALADRRVPADAVAAERLVRDMLGANGQLRVPHELPVRFLSSSVRALVIDTERLLFDSALRVITTARWRIGIPGPPQPLVPEARSWRPAEEWRQLPLTVPRPMWVTGSGSLGERWRSEIERLISTGREPACHELYREASVQRYDNPRSAIVIGLAAVEAGITSTAGVLQVPLPASQPSFAQLFEQTLPALAAKRPVLDRVLLPPTTVLEALSRARHLRNRVVHRGARVPTDEAVDEALEAARNLLLFLDFYGGHGWALAMADSRVLSAAGAAAGLGGAGDVLRAAWPDITTLHPLLD